MKVNTECFPAASGREASAQRRTQEQRTEVTIDVIVAAVGVTRGALYHQFDNKAALFAAVHEDVERDLLVVVTKGVTQANPPGAVHLPCAPARSDLEEMGQVCDRLIDGIVGAVDP